MLVENVQHVELHFLSGEVEQFTKCDVHFVDTRRTGTGERMKYYQVIIPIPGDDGEESTLEDVQRDDV